MEGLSHVIASVAKQSLACGGTPNSVWRPRASRFIPSPFIPVRSASFARVMRSEHQRSNCSLYNKLIIGLRQQENVARCDPQPLAPQGLREFCEKSSKKKRSTAAPGCEAPERAWPLHRHDVATAKPPQVAGCRMGFSPTEVLARSERNSVRCLR